MANLKGCFLHNSDDWKTPSYLYWWYVHHCGYFDPCPFLCDNFNGLEIDWPNNVFVNPPYSQIYLWVDKASKEYKKNPNIHIIFLVPSRTDTKWFKRLVILAGNIQFIEGRLHFNDSKSGAPFPSCLISIYHSVGYDCSCFTTNLDYIKDWYKEYLDLNSKSSS